MPPGDLLDRAHVGDLTVKMYRNDRLCSWCDRSFDLHGVDVVGIRLDIDENRPGAGPPDRSGSGKEGVGRGDHLVSRPDVDGQKRQQDRVRTRSTTDTAGGATIVGHL